MRRLLFIMSMVLQTGYGERLTYWLAPLVWIRHPLYASDWSWCYPIALSDIFKRTLGSAPRVRAVSSPVAGPYSVLDVSLDFQATQIIPLREFLKLETDSADLNGKRIIQLSVVPLACLHCFIQSLVCMQSKMFTFMMSLIQCFSV